MASFFWIVQLASVANPTGAQIAAGQDGGGTAALQSGEVEDVGQESPVIGLEASTLAQGTEYKVAWVHTGNLSSVVIGTFTTETDIVWAPIPVRRAWRKQISIVTVDWSNPITRGLRFCAPLSPQVGPRDIARNLTLTNVGATTATTRNGTYYLFGANKRINVPENITGISDTTPITIAWTETPMAPSGQGTILHWKPIGAVNGFLILRDLGSYDFVVGPRAAGAPRWVGLALVDGVPTRNVIQILAGTSNNSTANYVLWRDGVRIVPTTTASLTASTAEAFDIGDRNPTTNPYEGAIGNFHIWDRVLNDGEAKAWSLNEFITIKSQTTFALVPVQVSGPTLITVRPSADITTGAWTSTPSGDLYSVIDEVTYSDVDYISTTSASTSEVRLQSATDPVSSSNHTITFRAKGVGSLGLQVKLYQGTTLIATTTPTLTTSFQDFIWTLSGAEADAISDYSDLRVRFVAV